MTTDQHNTQAADRTPCTLHLQALVQAVDIAYQVQQNDGVAFEFQRETGALLEAAKAELEALDKPATPTSAPSEQALPPVHAGALPTMNQDPYPSLGDWWVQLWDGKGDDARVIARVYGSTPHEAMQRAEALAALSQPAASQEAPSHWDTICRAIKAADDHTVDENSYMLDSDDCIRVVRVVQALTETLAHPHQPSATSGDDSARLDYLQHGSTVSLVPGIDAVLPLRFMVGGLHKAVSSDLRAAIDIARDVSPASQTVGAERGGDADTDVRSILLDAVPGDGDGLEVYAKTVDDVVRKLTEMGEEIETLTEQRDEALRGPWPEWAEAIRKRVRDGSGYDGYDDADGVDLPGEVAEHLDEIEGQCQRLHDEIKAARAAQPAAPLFTASIAARKWQELQADGHRMTLIRFDGGKGGPGSIDPGGVVMWGAQPAAQQADGYREQHARDSAELRRVCQARDDARRERDAARAELKTAQQAREPMAGSGE